MATITMKLPSNAATTTATTTSSMRLLLLVVVFCCQICCAIGAVIDLNIDNLASTIKNHRWTCLLMYDGMDHRKNGELMALMEDLDRYFLAEQQQPPPPIQQSDVDTTNTTTVAIPSVGFATLDVRRHAVYRKGYYYTDEDEAKPFIHQYYTEFPTDAQGLETISPETFMKLHLGDVYYPAKIVLVGYNFNVYATFDPTDDEIQGERETKVAILAHWLQSTLPKDPSLVQVISLSPLQRDLQSALQNEDVDNSFPFTSYLERQQESSTSSSSSTNSNQDLGFVLETGAKVNANVDVHGHYTYKNWTLDAQDGSDAWLNLLGIVLNRYMIWVEGYESVWDIERRQREDEQCQFGTHLETMNKQLRNLVDRIFGSSGKDDGSLGQKVGQQLYSFVDRMLGRDDKYEPPVHEKKRSKDLAREELRKQVPVELKAYLDDMVFGYGRSPASLMWYLQNEVKEKLGRDAPTRREARKTASDPVPQLVMFERMRTYMKIVADTNRNSDLYEYPLADLVTQWHNILIAFHDNLNKSYKEYLNANPLPDNSFPRKTIEVLDMTDPQNYDLLTNYNAFHEKYTKAFTPVILGNVNMTDNLYTLEYLTDQCGNSDVTHGVQLSNKVGDKSSDRWAGLNFNVLPVTLMNDRRKEEQDRSLTLQQFISLSQKLGNVYLHNLDIPSHCAKLLHQETHYDEQQKLRIPSVLASYDLFHRFPLDMFSSFGPSLFIGSNGTNSKIHIDHGSAGFLMYLVSGRKRWIVTKPSERPFLYQSLQSPAIVPDILRIDKSLEANKYLTKRFPLLHRIEDVYEVIQEPGQLMYIPPDSPHAVENLDDTIAIALNLAPRDALANHLHGQIHLDREFGYTELALKYWLFDDNAHSPIPTKDPLYATYAEYKAQW